MKQSKQKKERKFAAKNSGCDSGREGDHGCDNCFQQHNNADMCFFQTENIVKSDFFLSSFHQETVAVDQKDHTEDNNNDFSGGKYHADFGSMADGLIKCRAVTKEFHHIDHGDAEDAGDHVRNVGTFIVADILDGQF